MKNIKQFRSKFLVLLLVLALTLTITGTSSSFASSIALPDGKNYIDSSVWTIQSNYVDSNENIFVKANTDYTLSIPLTIGTNVMFGEAFFPYIVINGFDGINYTIFDEMIQYEEEFSEYTDHTDMFSITFNTGAYTLINIEIQNGDDVYSEDITRWQLEEGLVSTAYEAYDSPDAVDNIAPIINGGTGVYLTNVNAPVTVATILAGLSATDETDGAITVVVQSDLYTGNEGTLGDYNVVFRATDLSGNYTEVTTIVRVVDIDSPIISLIGLTPLYVEFGTTYSEPGATVSDNYDSGLTATITGTVNNSVLATYTINYNVTDSSGNTATQVSRSVIVRDTIAPVQALTGDSTIYVEFGDNYTELGATWTDAYDVSGSSVISGSVNVGILGTYTVNYNITDTNGNVATTISRTIIVRDTTAPTFTGSTSYTWNISLYNNLNDLLALITASDLYSGDLTASIVVQSDTFSGNTTVLGTYTVVLRATDSTGNYTDMTITIDIIDDIAPTFTTTLTLLTLEYANTMTQQDLIDYFNN
ncbi:MAG: hypothetical protein KQ78_00835 [Candidatus Izimaplasma bacterium HR2]|nr:MAG: hypothetical protein KQ78_00835 [Candidatus Izimaplasma bacterium HR2]